MLISDRIFEILKKKGMSQKQFSEQTGIPQSTISDWRGKSVNPSADRIMIICEVLGVQPLELLSGTEAAECELPDYMIINRDTEEYNLVERFRHLKPEEKGRLLGYAEALTGYEIPGKKE